jgi:hypothetical protein
VVRKLLISGIALTKLIKRDKQENNIFSGYKQQHNKLKLADISGMISVAILRASASYKQENITEDLEATSTVHVNKLCD